MPPDDAPPTQELKDTALQIFDGLADSYERALDFATLYQDRYWKSWVAEESELGGSKLVLDVGCGTLLLEERLRASGSTVVGIDLTRRMIRIGQGKGLSNVPLLVNGDAEALPFKASSFDTVVSCYVAKYVDLERFTGELARVAKPRARIVVYDFVRPRGLFFPFLALYIYGAMRIAGSLLGLTKRKEAFTFKNLPRIVAGATWDMDFAAMLEKKDVRSGFMRRLSGGVVAGYVGTKGEGPDVLAGGLRYGRIPIRKRFA
ncbi:MAG: methyltransferase domain-containing protein [Thaumarchaeota archaeon]|nr:methyltransferase domain-containing protein [Nitrososphaerota archaeon]